MFVAKVIDGQIADTGTLADMYPNTSFPANGASDEWMAANSIQVVKGYRDYDKATQKLTKVTPYLDGGVVYDVKVEAMTTEEATAKTDAENERKAANVRKQRDRLLAETDYLALSDNTLTTEMAAYRQALRDITDHANFPDIQGPDMDGNGGDWPTKPE